MKVYNGTLDPDKGNRFVVTVDGKPLKRGMFEDLLVDCSKFGIRDAFDLSLSILTDCLGSADAARSLYKAFFWEFTFRLPLGPWELTESEIKMWVKDYLT